MDSYLISISQYLALAIFWIGAPFLLLGMLLLLGFKWVNPISVAITLVGVIGLACWVLGLSIEGLVAGEVVMFSRSTGTIILSKFEYPFGYWLVIIFYFSSASFFLGLSCWAIFRLIKKALRF